MQDPAAWSREGNPHYQGDTFAYGGQPSSYSNGHDVSNGSSGLTRLRVTIVSATGLRDADPTFFGKSDPYVICQINNRPVPETHTDVLYGTLNPVWHHQFEIADYVMGESITFIVMDKDMPPKSDDMLGHASLEAMDFYPGGFDGDVRLSDAGKGNNALLRVTVAVIGGASYGVPGTGNSPKPFGSLSLPVGPLSGQPPPPSTGAPYGGYEQSPSATGPPANLKVAILSALGLRNMDPTFWGKSDPYCICEIPGKPHSKFQTKVIRDTLNPEWNHETLVNDYNVGDPLMFTVMDEDVPPKSDDMLGQAMIESNQFFPHGAEGEVILSDAGKGSNARLRIRISVLSPVGYTKEEVPYSPQMMSVPQTVHTTSQSNLAPADLLQAGPTVSERPISREEMIANRTLVFGDPVRSPVPTPTRPAEPKREGEAARGDPLFMGLRTMMPM